MPPRLFGEAETMVSPEDLERVNREVNDLVRYQPDAITYRRPDVWMRPSGLVGDCEDYALEKWARLAAHGVPAEHLRLVLCWTLDGAYHCVLTARTAGGLWFVLDNRHDRILPWAWASRRYCWDRAFDWDSGAWRRLVPPTA